MKTLTISILIALFALPLFAQDDPEDGPADKPYSGIFGFGGGVDGMWYFMNTSDLNRALAERTMPALDTDGMFLFGGHGYVYVMVVPNFRIGGIGAGGTLRNDMEVDGQYRSTELSTSFGGFTMDYIIPFGQFHIGIGGMIGAGSHTLTMTRESTGLKTWDAIPENAGGRAVMENSFFAWQPGITAEYAFSPFIVTSLTGGYFGSSGDEWKLNDEFDVADVPDFGFANAFVRFQLTFGLFIPE